MIRVIVNRAFSHGLDYIEAYGLSSDDKPVTGIVTGSRFTEVDTGDVYAFDETGGTWNRIVAGPAAEPEPETEPEPTE